ncbi:MAG: DEAD/DEAH box helicase [Acidobacteria bacterium]|nr:MAG: DEAD/DEAH box helicase [Acidobacteriota bacterium]
MEQQTSRAQEIDLFERLKRKRGAVPLLVAPARVFFRLGFDQNRAYVEPVDDKGAAVEVGYEYCTGWVREAMKSLQSIREQTAFRIDWDGAGQRVWLADHDYLIAQLERCGPTFVDESFQPISFAPEEGRMCIVIREEGERLAARPLLRHQGEEIAGCRLLSENYAYKSQTVYSIGPLGPQFEEIQAFETQLAPAELEKYLSLLVSYLDQVEILYRGLRVVTGEPRSAAPSVVIESAEAEHGLRLRVSGSVPGFDEDFLEDYDIVRIATVNEMEGTITVREVVHTGPEACLSMITSALRRLRRNLEGGADFHLEGNLVIIDPDLASSFLHEVLPGLLSKYVVFGTDKLKPYRVRAGTPRLRLSLQHGIDFLAADVELEIDDQTVTLGEALKSFRTHGYLCLSDGTCAIINADYLRRLNRVFRKSGEGLKVSFFDLPLLEELIDENVARKEAALAQARKIIRGLGDLEHFEAADPDLGTELRPYQRHGYKWLAYLTRHGLGGCLADDMGLGKTVQTIALLAAHQPPDRKSSLIVMPRSLLFNWAAEVARFAPQLSTYVYHGPDRDLEAALRSDLVLTTYGTVRSDIERLREIQFDCVILDESQNIKNPEAQTSKAILLLRGRQRLALSGTPVENNLTELYSLFRFLNPSMFGSLGDFVRDYAAPIQRDNDKDALAELRRKVAPFILRRLKKDVLKELPDKVEQVLYVDMSPEQKILYEARRRYYYETLRAEVASRGIESSQFAILQAFTELRQLASTPEARTDNVLRSPKRELLVEEIRDLVASGHKVLVFANFLAALDGAMEDLDQIGVRYLVMTGATRDRAELVRQFQSDQQVQVFLMTLKTGGLGLNLTAADYVFIYDPWWNRAAENQAIDRTHRIGQANAVFTYRLITRGTIEEKMLELQKIKGQLFENLIVAEGATLKSLTEADIEFALRS